MIERNATIEKRQKELEREKLNSELAFLKNQISPHFFFNTLNNIYALISINAHDSQEAVLKLSKLMRYLLYESEHGKTLLSSEIEFTRSLAHDAKVVFTTACEKYALEGFRLDVVDYLLKPFSYEEFFKAVQKVQRLLKNDAAGLHQVEANADFLFLKSDYKISTIERSRIIFGKIFIPVSDQYKDKFQGYLNKNFL